MKNQNARPTAPPRPALTPVIILPLCLALTPDLCAQTGGGSTPRPGRATASAPRSGPAPTGIAERELIMREMEKEAAIPPSEAAAAGLPLEQIAADFKRIQIVNNRMLAAVIPSAEPDYRLISDANAEIRKCAARLKSNLSLPEPETAEGERRERQPPADAAQMKAALLLLDGALMRFVKNPLFKNADVVNAKEGARARRDLELVIELSGLIGKEAERLAKAARKR